MTRREFKRNLFGGKAMKDKRSTTRAKKTGCLKCADPVTRGCDDRGGRPGVRHVTGSDDKGNGFTTWIKSEEVFQRLEKLLIERHGGKN
jgi:hypothetical protein